MSVHAIKFEHVCDLCDVHHESEEESLPGWLYRLAVPCLVSEESTRIADEPWKLGAVCPACVAVLLTAVHACIRPEARSAGAQRQLAWPGGETLHVARWGKR